jgi:hypothetical protein
MKKLLIGSSLLMMFDCCHHEMKIKSDEKEQINSIEISSQLNFKNPAYMAGSDFLNLFKRFLINQDYKDMLLFTANETKRKFGEKSILEFYENNLRLGFDVKLKSVRFNKDSTMCQLNYEANIYATKEIKTIECLIESDSVKISLKNLQTIFQ